MRKKTPTISVVIPVYGCRTCLLELYERLTYTLTQISTHHEIIFVNDASPDHAWEVITEISEADVRVVGINLARNFGQHLAITAGVDYCSGDWVVVMDCDLQDQPEEIEKMYLKATKEDYDVVFGRRYERQDSFFTQLGGKLFYYVLDYFTENKSDTTIANFSVASRKVIDNFKHLREQNRSYPMFLRWLGFKTGYINIEHSERKSGKSTYTFSKKLKLATDVIVSQSNKPLRMSIKFGFTISFLSMIYGIYLAVKYFFLEQPVSGWTSLMVSMYFLGGLMFANLGILGLYIGRIFNEVKQRPLYVIRDVTTNVRMLAKEDVS
ncbi:glycosyltransferase family 2 protein [Paenibacillus gorillae]|uniref:glycosyltransferase family 2 protein n=1 Tax=Paenibacillus gorillae TaxID=1243662 RepID=UPI0004BAEBFD|nr:glycosyltransferase family 2 protein [Paenibacillus gorillae]